MGAPPWSEVRRYLAVNHGGEVEERLRARYEAGQEEHGDDWTEWPAERFAREIQQEMDDLRIYSAMQRYADAVRRGRVRRGR
jgi:hypothetical protein